MMAMYFAYGFVATASNNGQAFLWFGIITIAVAIGVAMWSHGHRKIEVTATTTPANSPSF